MNDCPPKALLHAMNGDPLEVVPLAGTAVKTAAGPEGGAMAQALNPAGGSSVGGTVTVEMRRSPPGAAVLRIEAAGLWPGAGYTAHLHAGSPSSPSASLGLIGSGEADAAGRLLLQAAEVTLSSSGVPVGLSTDLLFDGDHFLDVHGLDGTVVAISVLPRMEDAPTGKCAVTAVDHA